MLRVHLKHDMNVKPVSLTLAALLVVAGAWWAQDVWQAHRTSVTSGIRSRLGIGPENPADGVQPARTLRPPDPDRRFRDLTPEQRVELARRPHGVGG